MRFASNGADSFHFMRKLFNTWNATLLQEVLVYNEGLKMSIVEAGGHELVF